MDNQTTGPASSDASVVKYEGPKLRALIERLEKATGPDRSLDGEIFRLVDEQPGDRWELFDVGEDGTGVWYRECRDEKSAYIAPAFYTASIDAALTLIPPTQNWSLETEPCGHYAKTWFMNPPQTFGGQCCGVRDNEPASAAIAFCIAALRAAVGDREGDATTQTRA